MLKWVKFSSIAWTHDNKGFFYSRFDEPNTGNVDEAAQRTNKLQFQKVYYHFVGTEQSEDKLVHRNDEKANWMFITEVSNDGKNLIVYTTKNADDTVLMSIADISGGIPREGEVKLEFKNVVPEWIGGFQYIHNIGSHFYFKTNYLATKGRIIMIDIGNPEQGNWVELIP